jgi:hypothetical protein
LHGCLAEGLLEDAGEGGPGHVAQLGQVVDGPWFGGAGVHRFEGGRQARVGGGAEPRRGGFAAGQPSPQAEYAQVLRPLAATLASGNGARPNSDVLDVTGTAPVTFAEFVAKTAPAWK